MAAYGAAGSEIEALLLGGGGKFALPQPLGQTLGESGGLLLAMHGDELAESRTQGGLSEQIDVDAVKQRLGESFADIGERGATGVGHRQLVEGARKGQEHNAGSLWPSAAPREALS